MYLYLLIWVLFIFLLQRYSPINRKRIPLSTSLFLSSVFCIDFICLYLFSISIYLFLSTYLFLCLCIYFLFLTLSIDLSLISISIYVCIYLSLSLMNDWCFRLGRSPPGRMRWILVWIIPLEQAWSFDMLASSPALYHCIMDAFSPHSLSLSLRHPLSLYIYMHILSISYSNSLSLTYLSLSTYLSFFVYL